MQTNTEILREGGFFFPVTTSPLYTSDGAKTAMQAVLNSESRSILGYVRQRYTPVDNESAFDFIDNVTDLTLEKFGSRRNGHSYVIGSFPSVDILGDAHQINLILENSFDGSTPIRATYCMLRMICQNQFSVTWKKNPTIVRLKHVRSAVGRLDDAKTLMAGAQDYLKKYIAAAEELACKQLTSEDIDGILTEYLKIKDASSEKVKSRLIQKKEMIISLVAKEDHENFKNTAWALINGVTNFNSHLESMRATKENWEIKRYFKNAQGSLYQLANLALAA